jgi:translation initiation factor IF-3
MGRHRPQNNRDDSNRVNEQIRVPRVLLIDEMGKKLGEFLTEDAVQLAKDRQLDLVEVQPNASPPVCKILDYGKLKYEKKKRDRENRRNQATTTTKEIRLRPKTDDHDIDVKARNARKFLEAGNKVKVTIRFRGREHAHRDIGADQCFRILDVVNEDAEIAEIESQPRMEGRQMFMILSPVR